MQNVAMIMSAVFRIVKPFFAEGSIVVGALSSHIFAKQFVLIQSEQALFGLTVLLVVADSLKDFQKYEVADSDRPLDYGGIKQISVRVGNSLR